MYTFAISSILKKEGERHDFMEEKGNEFKKVYKYMNPTFKNASIYVNGDKEKVNEKSLRVRVAKIQVERKAQCLEDIKEYSKSFLDECGLKYLVDEFKIDVIGKEDKAIRKKLNEEYKRLREDQGLGMQNNDIVWIKFAEKERDCNDDSYTENEHVGVVGTSCDIDFSDKATSTKIIKSVGYRWSGKVLAIPLKNIPDGLNRHLIESAYGNYLISKGVPIIDYYSHNM